MKLITITTDFQDQFAAAQVKAVALAGKFKGELIENHSITLFSITEGAFQIQTLARFTPKGTIHIGVVDPGVGSTRSGIVIKTAKDWFIGPDNGLLYPAAFSQDIKAIWKIDEKCFGRVSPTFHGRDVFIKAAVLLSHGKSPRQFGCTKIKALVKLQFQPGQILHIDSYGNAKTYGNGHLNLPQVKTFADLSPGEAGQLWGSSDTWEIVVNQASAADKFGLILGQIVKNL